MTDPDERYNPDSFYRNASEAFRRKDFHQSLAFLKQAFAYGKAPRHAVLFGQLASRLRDKESWREAEESLLEWLRVCPESEQARSALSDLHSDPKRFYDIRTDLDDESIEALAERTVLSKVPRVQLFIELTNSCNGRCITCLNKSMKRSRGIMDLDLFRKIVDESVKSLYLEAVHLYGVGEDYLIPNVMDYFDYAIEKYHDAGVRTVLITNGELVNRLPDRISSVDISFNAGTRKSFEEITGLDFDQTVHNIWRLERENNLDHNVNLHMLVFNRNVGEVEEFKKLFAFTGANLVMAYKYDNQCGTIEDDTVDEFKSSKKIPCHYVRNVINVCWNGDVILCPHDFDASTVHGNVKSMSFEQIWYNKIHTTKMIEHNNSTFEGLCCSCNFNVPINDQNVIVSKEERIALRKRYLDYALEHMISCDMANTCAFIKRYRENLEQMEHHSNSLIRICSDDPRFYGMDAVLNTSTSSACPHLASLRKRSKEARITWEGPIFGPSGYAFAARNYVLGLADLGVAIRPQPIWHDCRLKVLDL